MSISLFVAWCMTLDGALIPPAEAENRLGPAARTYLQAFRECHPLLAAPDPGHLAEALEAQSRLGMSSARLEGDPELAGAAFDQGLATHVLCIISPTLARGPHCVPPVGGRGVSSMAEAWELELPSWIPLGEDMAVEGRLLRPSPAGAA